MTVKTIALDIETVPVDLSKIPIENIDYLITKDKNARTNRFFKKEMKESKYYKDHGVLEFDRKSIGRFELNQIICCCMYDGMTFDKIGYTTLDSMRGISQEDMVKMEVEVLFSSEKELLQNINEILNNYAQIVTFNGNSFDLPMIRMRSLLNDVKTSISHDIKPWDNLQYLDVKYMINGADKYAVGDLGYWCRVFGVKPPDWGGNAEHKDKLKQLWLDGRIDEIIEGCCGDVRATWELYNKIK